MNMRGGVGRVLFFGRRTPAGRHPLLEQPQRAVVARLGSEVLQGRLGVGRHQSDLRAVIACPERLGRSHDRFGVARLRRAQRRHRPGRHALFFLELTEYRDRDRTLGGHRRARSAREGSPVRGSGSHNTVTTAVPTFNAAPVDDAPMTDLPRMVARLTGPHIGVGG